MASQTVLPFKLGSTDETLTPYAGVALFGEYCHALGLPAWIDAAPPRPGSGAGYAASHGNPPEKSTDQKRNFLVISSEEVPAEGNARF